MVGRRSRSRLFVALTAVAAAALVFRQLRLADVRIQPGPDPLLARQSINGADASTLRQLFVSSGEFGPPCREDNGVVYAECRGKGNLDAFDANGVTNCSGTPQRVRPAVELYYHRTDIPQLRTPPVANRVV